MYSKREIIRNRTGAAPIKLLLVVSVKVDEQRRQITLHMTMMMFKTFLGL